MVGLVVEFDQHLPRQLWEDLVGLPFHKRGRGPDAYDCFGLLCEIYRRRGIIIPDLYYDEDPIRQAELLMQGAQSWRPCPKGPGAAVLFRQWSNTAPSHVGVMINEDLFIHASEDLGQVALGYISRSPANLILGWFIPPDSYDRTARHAV